MGASQSSNASFLDLYKSGRQSDETAQALLKRGVSPNARVKGGIPVLCIAAQNGSLNAVKLLIKYGADPLQRCPRGRNALMHAIGYKHEDVAVWLIMHVSQYKEVLFQKDQNKKDVLYIAARKDQVNVAMYALIGIYTQGYPVELGRPMAIAIPPAVVTYADHIRRISKSVGLDYVMKQCTTGVRGVMSGIFPYSTQENFLYTMRSPQQTDMLISSTSPQQEGWSATQDNLSGLFNGRDGKTKKSQLLAQLYRARVHDMGVCVRMLDSYAGKRVVVEPYNIYAGDSSKHSEVVHTGHQSIFPLQFQEEQPLLMDIRLLYLSLVQIYTCKDTLCHCNTPRANNTTSAPSCAIFPPVLPYMTIPKHMINTDTDADNCYVHDSDDQKGVKMSLCATGVSTVKEVSLDQVYKYCRTKNKYSVDVPKFNGVPGFVVVSEFEHNKLNECIDISNVATNHIVTPMLQVATFPAIHCIDEPVTIPGVCTELSTAIPELGRYYSFTGSSLTGRVHPKENMCTCLSRKTVDKELVDTPVRVRLLPDRSGVAVTSLQKEYKLEQYSNTGIVDGDLIIPLDSQVRLGSSSNKDGMDTKLVAVAGAGQTSQNKSNHPEHDKPFLVQCTDNQSIRIKSPTELTQGIAFNLEMVANARSMCRKALYMSAHFFTVYQQYIQLLVHSRMQAVLYKRIAPFLHEYLVHLRVSDYMSTIRRTHGAGLSSQITSISNFLKNNLLQLLKHKPNSSFSPLAMGQKQTKMYDHSLPMNMPLPASPLEHPKFMSLYEQYVSTQTTPIEPKKVFGNGGVYHVFDTGLVGPPPVPTFQTPILFVDTTYALQNSLKQYVDSVFASGEEVQRMPHGTMKVNALEALQVQGDKIAGAILTVEKFLNWLLLYSSGTELGVFPCCQEQSMITGNRVVFIPTPGMNMQFIDTSGFIKIEHTSMQRRRSESRTDEKQQQSPSHNTDEWKDKVVVLPPIRNTNLSPSPSSNHSKPRLSARSFSPSDQQQADMSLNSTTPPPYSVIDPSMAPSTNTSSTSSHTTPTAAANNKEEYHQQLVIPAFEY